MKKVFTFPNYTSVQLLSRGEDVAVYFGQHKETGSYHVIKCFSKTRSNYTRFHQEIRVLQQLQIPYVPTLYGYSQDMDSYVLWEEYMDGLSLQTLISSNSTIQVTLFYELVQGLCDFLQALHGMEKPLLYLDLKPEHVFLTKKGVRVIDFDHTLYLQEETPVSHYGTSGFAAPELYTRKILDVRADVYNLAAVLAHVWKCVEPQSNTTVEKVLKKGMFKYRTFRYGSMQAFREALERSMGETSENSRGGDRSVLVPRCSQ